MDKPITLPPKGTPALPFIPGKAPPEVVAKVKAVPTSAKARKLELYKLSETNVDAFLVACNVARGSSQGIDLVVSPGARAMAINAVIERGIQDGRLQDDLTRQAA